MFAGLFKVETAVGAREVCACVELTIDRETVSLPEGEAALVPRMHDRAIPRSSWKASLKLGQEQTARSAAGTSDAGVEPSQLEDLVIIRAKVQEALGSVAEWNDRDGWGVLLTPDGQRVWCHYSQVQVEGYRTLVPGGRVEFDYETPGDDGFDARVLTAARPVV